MIQNVRRLNSSNKTTKYLNRKMKNEIEYKKDVEANTRNSNVSSQADCNVQKLGYDLYLVGKVCVVVLRAILVGAKTCFIPTVKAAPPPKEPERPKPMKFMDLPMYDCPPHVQYKDHLVKKMGCPETKILHNVVHPHVVALRKEVVKNLDMAKTEVVSTVNMVTKELDARQKHLLDQCRSPSNETERQIAIVVGSVLGFVLGRGSLTRRIMMTGVGTTIVGSLCYPKETDEGVRTFCFYARKGFAKVVAMYCGKDIAGRGRVPCRTDLPEIPPPIPKYKINQCPKK